MNTDTALSGSLKDFGLVEILQVIEMGNMTGAIHLKHSNGRIGILYCNEGKLASCNEMDPGALTLGDILQQLKMTTYRHLEEAHAQQLQDPLGKRIGERLVMMGAISENQLNEALRTKTIWTARDLALWHDGKYEFFSSSNIHKLLPYGESSLDIEVVRVSMEIVRYSDEWQELIKFLPQGMRTTLQLVPAITYTMLFDIQTLELLTHVNLYRRIRSIASAMQQPEMDIARNLSQLVQLQLIAPLQQENTLHINGRKVRLPEPAEKLRMENFALLDLISRMEQEWDKRHTPMEQLPTLAEFINWTMDALTETCRAKKIDLDPNTLHALMVAENLWHIGSYKFLVEQNHINIEDFSQLCYEIMAADIGKAAGFYDEASMVLQRLLCCIFDLINSRVANPKERLENQDVWEAMFEQFALQRHK